jgi:hypothetical protein
VSVYIYRKGNSFPKEVVVKEYSVESIEQEGSPEPKERTSIANRGHGEKMHRLMEAAILALLESRTFKEAARKIGVAESTLRSWYRDPVFREHYAAARRHILEVGTMEIAALKLEGIAVLREELRDWANPAIRHAAAKFVVTLPDRELHRLDAERRFNASQEKSADKQRGHTTFFEVLEHCGTTVPDFLDPVCAARQKGDPEVTDHEKEDTPPARSAQIGADHREKEDDSRDGTDTEPCDEEERRGGSSSQIGADHRHGDDDSEERRDAETAEGGGYGDGGGCATSAQVIADNGKTDDSRVQDNGDCHATTKEPIGDGGARDHGRSAQIDADAQKTDGAHPVGDSTTRAHTGNEHKPKPAMIRRRSVHTTAVDDVRQANEGEQKPSQNHPRLLSAEEETAREEDAESARREARLRMNQVLRERYPEGR